MSLLGRRSNARKLRLERLTARQLLASDLVCFSELPLHPMADIGSFSDGAEYGPAYPGIAQSQDVSAYTHVDDRGLEYAFLPEYQNGLEFEASALGTGGESGGSGGSGGSTSPASLPVPVFHSKPDAPKKIYLDFDGEMVSGTFWNNRVYHNNYNTGAIINAPAFSIDGDRSNLSAVELTVIREVWARMAEDFAPFQVDVTTADPGRDFFLQGGQAIRVLISTDTDATTNQQWFPNAGGVAYLGSWNFTNGSPVWVFYNRLGTSNSKNIAEAGSHEVGHAFGLHHDGRTSPSEQYYRGHGTGQTGWAPIMGVGYDRPVTQWSRGEYANASRTEDDLAIISGFVPYEPDDHGDTIASATTLSADSTGRISATGLIATRTDKDLFSFFTLAGSVTLDVAPFELSSGKANLDIQMQVIDSAGTVVATINPPDRLDATWTAELQQGVYTVAIDGVGRAAIMGDQGYSDYGSLGWYTLSGSVVPYQSLSIEVNVASVAGTEGNPVSNTGVWAPADANDVVTLSASIGSVEKFADGTWSWSYTPQDQLPETIVEITAVDDRGASRSATFALSVTNLAPVLTVVESVVSGNVLSLLSNGGTWSDVPADLVSLSSSLGNVTKNSDGTWSWSFTPSQSYMNQTVTITGTDEDGGSTEVAFTMDAQVALVNSKVFYKGSSFAETSVDAALDTSKVLAKASTVSQLLSFANLINTTQGINGLVFDVAGLASTSLTTSDFVIRMSPTDAFDEAANPPSSWGNAPSPSAIDVTAGTATTPARVRIEWPDNAIANRWLQIKVLANTSTGLQSPEVYYIGHLLGETNGLTSGGAFEVSIGDVTNIRPLVGTTAGVSSVQDITKNGLIQISDITAMRTRVGVGQLRVITIPAAGSDDEGEGEGGFGGGASFAAPGVDIPKTVSSGDVREIKARLTDESFDVPLPSILVTADFTALISDFSLIAPTKSRVNSNASLRSELFGQDRLHETDS